MSTTIRIPMSDLFYEELEDAFIDEKETADDFIWHELRALCKDAKLGKLKKSCTINVLKDGVQQQEIIKIRGLELVEFESNTSWIPKNLELDEVKYFEHQVTDNTLKYLMLFASFTELRHRKYIDSLIQHNENLYTEMCKKNKNPNVLSEARKTFDQTTKNYKDAIPTCLEEILFNAIFPKIHEKVSNNVDKAFDKENEELYPKEESVKK